ncbi:MAG: dihydropteroate synthase [Sphingobacteriaceae bacterium]|nr:dihydropteroate synthase [Sphingobacteriaceae bacterium]
MDKDTLFPIKTTLQARGRLLSIERPLVMGIVNLTPDSFYAGSRLWDAKRLQNQLLIDKAAEMLEQGAQILDLGAYSTRPGAADVLPGEERDRLLPAVALLSETFPKAWLSVDTFRASIAEEAIAAGAHIINDVSGGNLDEAMFDTVARCAVPYILMHMRGTPANMTQLNQYEHLVTDVVGELLQKAHQLRLLGVKDIVLDPGFGFAKNVNQNFELLSSLKQLSRFGYPVLAGISRKSMIYKTLQVGPEEALNGTTFLHAFALSNGARILRVHDVKAAAEAAQLYSQLHHV